MSTELKTRIILRNDSTANWTANETTVLLKGEVGIEFNPNATTAGKKILMKIGDGTTAWKDLPYFGGEEAHVYEAQVAKGGDHSAAIATALNGATPNTHDIAIVKEAVIAADKLGMLHRDTSLLPIVGMELHGQRAMAIIVLRMYILMKILHSQKLLELLLFRILVVQLLRQQVRI